MKPLLKTIYDTISKLIYAPLHDKSNAAANLSSAQCSYLFTRIMAAGLSDATALMSSVERMLKMYAAQTSTGKSESLPLQELRGSLCSIIRAVSQRYPSEFDHVVQRLSATSKGKDDDSDLSSSDSAPLTVLLRDAFESTAPYRIPSENGVGLLLSLSHTTGAVRKEAIDSFVQTISMDMCNTNPTSDLVGIAAAVLRCANDDDAEVVAAVCDVPVLSRIASLLGSSTLLESISVTFTVWTQKFQEKPKKASSVLRRLLSAIYSSPFVTQVVSGMTLDGSVDDDEKEMSSPVHLLLHILLSCVQIGTMTLPDHSEKYLYETMRAVDCAFVEFESCSSLFGGHKPAMEGRHAPSKESAVSVVWEAMISGLAATLKKNITKNSSVVLEELMRLRHSFEMDETSLAKDNASRSRGAIRCALTICTEALCIFDKHTAVASSLGEFVLTWVGQSYEDWLSSPIKGYAADDLSLDLLLDKALRKIATLNCSTKSKKHEMKNSVANVCSAYGLLLSNRDVNARLLVTLLSMMCYDCDRFAPLIGLCSEYLLTSTPTHILHTIAAPLREVSTNSCSIESPLIISQDARIGALYTLAAYHGHVGQATDEEMAGDILSALPLIVCACTDPSASVRSGGAALARQLSSIYHGHSGSTTVKGFIDAKSSHKVSIDDVLSLFRELAEKEKTLSLDELSASNTLLARIYTVASPSATSLCQFLMDVTACIGWKSASMSYQLLSMAANTPIAVTWSALKHLLAVSPSESIKEQGYAKVADAIMVCCTRYAPTEYPTPYADMVTSFEPIILDSHTNTATAVLRRSFLQHIAAVKSTEKSRQGWIDTLELVDRERLFQLLVSQMSRNQDEDFLSAIRTIPVSVATACNTLLLGKADLETALRGNDAEETSSSVSRSLAAPLQRLGWCLEAVVNVLQSGDASDSASFSRCAVALLDMLKMLNTPAVQTVLTIAYTRGLLLDLACTCLSAIGAELDSGEQAAAPKKKSKGKKGSTTETKTESEDKYTLSRVNSDIDAILEALKLSSTSYIQTFSLRLLDILISLSPASANVAVLSLSKMLASSTVHESISSEDSNGMVGSILSTLTTIRGSSTMLNPQEALEPFFSMFQGMPNSKRAMLVNIVRKEYDDGVLPVAAAIILAHAYAAHALKSSEDEASFSESVGGSSEGEVFVLLSRSAQRKANRSVRLSVAEEFFHLATNLAMQASVRSQLELLTNVTKFARRTFFLLVSNDMDRIEANDYDDEGFDASKPDELTVQITDAKPCQFQLLRLMTYADQLVASEIGEDGDSKDSAPKSGAALAILQLEYILEYIESKQFHSLISRTCSRDKGVHSMSPDMQKLFLLLCEQLLELLSYATRVQMCLAGDKQSVMCVKIGTSVLRISSPSFARQVWTLCLDIINGIQKLLDGPTFVIILQELLSHENMNVRQKSLHILSDRLQSMGDTKTSRFEVSAL